MTEYGIKELKHRVKENKVLTFEERKYINQALTDIQAYRAIGTVEECRTAVERMKPRKPLGSNWKYCPNCKMQLLGGDGNCGICKQPIDWSE